MLLSMTGFGKAEADYAGRNINVVVKSVNGKMTDVSVRLPGAYREKENEIRTLVNQELERGKVDVIISIDRPTGEEAQAINTKVFLHYVHQLKELADEFDVSDDKLFIVASRLPNVLSAEKETFDEGEWTIMDKTLHKAVAQLKEFRKTEGLALARDLKGRVESILALQAGIRGFEQERMKGLRAKIRRQLDELPQREKIDHDRFEQEMIYYLERLDITEENVRLETHGKFFLETMNEQASQGRKLNFIAQEMGREINTIGSKANHAAMQKVVVEMKDELEKIKEQLQNVL